VLTHPVGYASYAVPVRQYRYLQSCLLQCMDHSKPPCHLLMLRDVTPAHKRLSLSGFLISKNYIYHSGHTHAYWQYLGWMKPLLTFVINYHLNNKLLNIYNSISQTSPIHNPLAVIYWDLKWTTFNYI